MQDKGSSMEPSSASPSWAKSRNAISTDSAPPFAPPSAEPSSGPRAGDLALAEGREGAEHSGIFVPNAVVESIIEVTSDPPNRLYRYPVARALLPITRYMPWLTPNHVTYAHIVIGLVAAAIVAFAGEGTGPEVRGWFVV